MESLPHLTTSGFNLCNVGRLEVLLQEEDYMNFVPPKAMQTGTTIAAIIYKDGVVLGADTRCTQKNIVANKCQSKISALTDNIYCAGAGTSADAAMTMDMLTAELELLHLETERQVLVVAAEHLLRRWLFRFQGEIQAAFVLGGYDKHGPHIYSVSCEGSSCKLPYATMGSGSLAAMAIFESRWQCDMSEDDAKKLVCDAVSAGISNDLASGSNVDLCIIRKDDSEFLRNYKTSHVKGKRRLSYSFKPGTTAVLHTKIEDLKMTKRVLPIPNEVFYTP